MQMSALDSGALQQAKLAFNRSSRTASVSQPLPRANPVVFSTTLIEEDGKSRGKRVARTGLALVIQVLVVATLLLAPLVVTEAIDLHQLDRTILIAPPPPAAPAPPVVRAQPAVAKLAILKPELTAPTIIPKKIVASASDVGAAPAISDANGVVGGTGDVLGAPLAAVPPPPAAAARPKGPIRISTGMREPRLLSAPPVEYSPIARLARIQGTVILEAIIDEQGNVTQVRAISGPAMLFQSAIKAVQGRKYEVTYLDGEPVAIRLDVTVNFHLS
jgi:periplasmic protein TonB